MKSNNNPRSTVGTVTDINDYLRLLYSTAGKGCCPECGQEPVPMLQPPYSTKKNWMVGRDRPFLGFVHEMEHWYKQYIHKSSAAEAFV